MEFRAGATNIVLVIEDLTWSSQEVHSAGKAEGFTTGVKVTGKVTYINKDMMACYDEYDTVTHYLYLHSDKQQLNYAEPDNPDVNPDGYWGDFYSYYEKIS